MSYLDPIRNERLLDVQAVYENGKMDALKETSEQFLNTPGRLQAGRDLRKKLMTEMLRDAGSPQPVKLGRDSLPRPFLFRSEFWIGVAEFLSIVLFTASMFAVFSFLQLVMA